MTEKENKKSEVLNEKIKSTLLYVGFASAGISAFAYIILTFVMVKGFSTNLELLNQLLFAIIGAVVGIAITMSLVYQGVSFAKQNEHAKEAMADYYEALNKTKKEKKLHTITHYLIIKFITTLVSKGITIGLSTFFVLYIFIEGNDNWGLLGLAFSNVFLFVGFGLMGLSSAYDFYLQQHIPVIKDLTRRYRERAKEKGVKNEVSKTLEVSKSKREETNIKNEQESEKEKELDNVPMIIKEG